MVKIKPDKIIRSKRRSIALVVTSDATLVVRAPLFIPLNLIQSFVDSKNIWIRERVEEMQRRPKISKKEFVSGEGFLFLGKSYKLELSGGNNIELKENLLFPKSLLPIAQEELIKWYKKKALEKITERIVWYTKTMGLNYNKIKVTSAQKRWGSCSAKGNLNFGWRLIMAPLQVIDYVVVHELSHIDEKNHSKKFWNKVKVTLPNYTESKKWLVENSQQTLYCG